MHDVLNKKVAYEKHPSWAVFKNTKNNCPDNVLDDCNF